MIINSIITAFLLFLISQALSIHYSTFNFFDVSLAGVFVLTPNVYYYLNTILLLPCFLSFILSFFITIVFNLVIYRIVYIPLKSKNISNTVLIIFSIGLYEILIGIIGFLFGNDTRIISMPFFSNANYLSKLSIFVIANFIVWFIWKNTNYGRVCRALLSNPTLVSIQGVNTTNYYYISASIATLIFSLLGLFVSQQYDISNNIGFEYLLYGLSILLISGNYSTLHLFSASLIFSFTIDLTAYYFGGQWKIAFAFIVLIIIIALNPSGLSSKRNKKTLI